MVPSRQDQGANNTTVGSAPATPTESFSFNPSMTLLTIGHNWCASNWAGGVYNRRVYDTPGNTVTITLPTPMSAVYFYAQPDDHLLLNLTATAQDGTSVSSGPTPSQSYSCSAPECKSAIGPVLRLLWHQRRQDPVNHGLPQRSECFRYRLRRRGLSRSGRPICLRSRHRRAGSRPWGKLVQQSPGPSDSAVAPANERRLRSSH